MDLRDGRHNPSASMAVLEWIVLQAVWMVEFVEFRLVEVCAAFLEVTQLAASVKHPVEDPLLEHRRALLQCARNTTSSDCGSFGSSGQHEKPFPVHENREFPKAAGTRV